MHVRAFAIKNFFRGYTPEPPLSGKGPREGREGTEDEGKGGHGKGGDGGVVERRRGGREGRGGEGWGGQGGEWGKELWRTTFECLPPRLTARAARGATRAALESNTYIFYGSGSTARGARRAAKIATRSSRPNRNLFDFWISPRGTLRYATNGNSQLDHVGLSNQISISSSHRGRAAD
jgi:hypothetical protein